MKNKNKLGLYDALNFGKHKDESITNIIADDPQYLKWCLENISDFRLDEIAIQELEIALGEILDFPE